MAEVLQGVQRIKNLLRTVRLGKNGFCKEVLCLQDGSKKAVVLVAYLCGLLLEQRVGRP